MNILRLSSSIADLQTKNIWKSLIAEFFGTYILVFISNGAAYNNPNPVKIGLATGFGAIVSMYCFGSISGAHINPAVSFGFLVARQISLIRFLLYCIVQIIAALAGFGSILLATNGNVFEKSTFSIDLTKIPNIGNVNNVKMVEVFKVIDDPGLKVLCELVITFVMVLTIMRLCVEKSRTSVEQGIAPLIIGLTIVGAVYCGINISGGSMNPAISLSQYVFKKIEEVWTQIVGPLCGAGLAALFQQLVLTSELSREHAKKYLFSSNFDTNRIPKSTSKEFDSRLTQSF